MPVHHGGSGITTGQPMRDLEWTK